MLRTNEITRVLVALAFLTGASPLAAQESPLASFLLTGYGSATYGSSFTEDAFDHDFTASVSPVVLYSMGENLLFEAELEFGLSGEATTTTLEYAQIDYLGFDHVVLSAGKFLLPFGLFGDRLHPAWVNRLPNAPLLYGHAHGGVAEGALLPIMSDAGAMAKLALPMGERWGLDLSIYVTQGPRMVVPGEAGDDHADGDAHRVVPRASLKLDPLHDEAAPGAAAGDIPALAFGTSFADNNNNKLIGARLGLVRGPGFEIHVSGFHAMYDEDDFLDVLGGNLAIDVRRGPWDFKTEAMLLRQEIQAETSYQTVSKPGYYIQAGRRFGMVEPVLRWSHLLDATVDGSTLLPERKRMAVGIDFWVEPSIPLKVMYEWGSLDTDRVIVQWAFGF